MEFRIAFESDEEVIGDFATFEIEDLVKLLKAGTIVDIDGDAWDLASESPLYFSSYPPYFYVSPIKEE